MSFFGRVMITAVVVAGVVHVFRRDIGRILGALQKPTQNFIKEVQKELDVQKAGAGIVGSSSSSISGASSGVLKHAAGVQAAAEQQEGKAAADGVASGGASAGPGVGPGTQEGKSDLR
jgi:hypothetical protein